METFIAIVAIVLGIIGIIQFFIFRVRGPYVVLDFNRMHDVIVILNDITGGKNDALALDQALLALLTAAYFTSASISDSSSGEKEMFSRALKSSSI